MFQSLLELSQGETYQAERAEYSLSPSISASTQILSMAFMASASENTETGYM